MGCHTTCIGSALMAKKKKKIEDDERIGRYLRKMKSINRAKKRKEKRGKLSLQNLLQENLSPCMVDF
jgi:excinuclease UvrABC ATPase subunit